MSALDHSLRVGFRDQLISASKSGWWRDILEDKELIIALRGKYLNVYWKGQSIFNVKFSSKELKVSTHEKYLLDPKLSRQVLFDGKTFDTSALEQKAFLREYATGALERMKKAAEIYSGAEKKGCHWIALRKNNSVIDVEIALPGTVEKGEAGEDVQSPRVDLLALEPLGNDKAQLVFWEAKDFENSELGSARPSIEAPVLSQLAAYRSIIEKHRSGIEASYTRVCSDLCAIRGADDQRLNPIVREVAEGKRKVTLVEMPQVNLVVFGLNEAERDSASWIKHKKTLEEALAKQCARLRAVGEPKKLILKRASRTHRQ